MELPWGAWVAQVIKHLTLDFGSGRDLTICEFDPHIGLWAETRSMLGILFAPPPLTHTLTLSLISNLFLKSCLNYPDDAQNPPAVLCI